MGIRDALAERTAAIRTLTLKLLRLEIRWIFKQRILKMVVIRSWQDSDDALDDLAIADD